MTVSREQNDHPLLALVARLARGVRFVDLLPAVAPTCGAVGRAEPPEPAGPPLSLDDLLGGQGVASDLSRPAAAFSRW
jgi:hypothetical protein